MFAFFAWFNNPLSASKTSLFDVSISMFISNLWKIPKAEFLLTCKPYLTTLKLFIQLENGIFRHYSPTEPIKSEKIRNEVLIK